MGEKSRCLSEGVVDDAGRETKLHIVRHCLNSDDDQLTLKISRS